MVNERGMNRNDTRAPGGAPRLAILAASGSLPVEVATAAVAAGRNVLVIGLEGAVDERIKSFPHAMLKWGQFGRVFDLIDEHDAAEVVIVGAVDQRPDFRAIGVDADTALLLPKVNSLLVGGDDNVMRGLSRLIEDKGYRVVGAHQIAPKLVAEPGLTIGRAPSGAERRDAQLAMRAARLIGTLDAGQAAVVVKLRVVALEGAEGTDAMLQRVGELRRNGRAQWSGRMGVLAKCAKPQQDVRVDLPTIGPRTVAIVAEAGLAGIAIEPGRVMIADRAETDALVRRTGTFILADNGRDGVSEG